MGPRPFPDQNRDCICVGIQVKGHFQNGITLGGRTSANSYMIGLKIRVAKKFAKFLHLS